MQIKMALMITPTTNDILLGRGKTYHYHTGNQRFRATIAVHIPKYAEERTTRKQKSKIVESIVEGMYEEGCRFLKQDVQSFLWYEIGRQKAKKKVGHALRDATAEMHRSLKRADLISSRTRLMPFGDRVTFDPQPVQSQSAAMDMSSDLHKSTAESDLSQKVNSSVNHPAEVPSKVDDDSAKSSGDSCGSDSGAIFLDSSGDSKYADLEPISIANIALSAQPQISYSQIVDEDKTYYDPIDDVSGNIEQDFFSSILDMLNQASSVMKDSP